MREAEVQIRNSGLDSCSNISAEVSHVKDGVHYPAILLTTGMNDPRVVPWEPGKMAARLQGATGSGKPVLLRVEHQGGHGGVGGAPAAAAEERWRPWRRLCL